MNCCSGGDASCFDEQFDDRTAKAQLRVYQKKGPTGTTRRLVELLRRGASGASILDIGGGVGTIQHELFDAGAAAATHVDASRSYLAASRMESERRGTSDRVTLVQGDFVKLAPTIPPADIVTLDRVICCYHDMDALVEASTSRALHIYGIVVPDDVWWMRAMNAIGNAFRRLRGRDFRSFIHPLAAIEKAVRAAGLEQVYGERAIGWHVRVYRRTGASQGRAEF